MDKRTSTHLELQLMEAFALEKMDGGKGIPDVEEELRKVRAKAANTRRGYLPKVRIAAAAAAVVLVAGIGMWGYRQRTVSQDICVAYVGGERVTDEACVMALLSEEMSQMSCDDAIIENQLSDIFN